MRLNARELHMFVVQGGRRDYEGTHWRVAAIMLSERRAHDYELNAVVEIAEAVLYNAGKMRSPNGERFASLWAGTIGVVSKLDAPGRSRAVSRRGQLSRGQRRAFVVKCQRHVVVVAVMHGEERCIAPLRGVAVNAGRVCFAGQRVRWSASVEGGWFSGVVELGVGNLGRSIARRVVATRGGN